MTDFTVLIKIRVHPKMTDFTVLIKIRIHPKKTDFTVLIKILIVNLKISNHVSISFKDGFFVGYWSFP